MWERKSLYGTASGYRAPCTENDNIESEKILMLIDSLLESIMLICFAAAWPASIHKSWTSRTRKGKSLFFLLIVFSGYMAGITRVLLRTTAVSDLILHVQFAARLLRPSDLLQELQDRRRKAASDPAEHKRFCQRLFQEPPMDEESVKNPGPPAEGGPALCYLFLGIERALGVTAIPPSDVQRSSGGSILPEEYTASTVSSILTAL